MVNPFISWHRFAPFCKCLSTQWFWKSIWNFPRDDHLYPHQNGAKMFAEIKKGVEKVKTFSFLGQPKTLFDIFFFNFLLFFPLKLSNSTRLWVWRALRALLKVGPSGYANTRWGHLNSQIRPYAAIAAPGLYAGFLSQKKFKIKKWFWSAKRWKSL